MVSRFIIVEPSGQPESARVLRDYLSHGSLILPGAAGLATVLTNRAEFKGQNVVVIASGGNVDQEIFALALKRLNA